MSGLQLYTNETVIDLFLVTETGNHLKASVKSEIEDHKKQIAVFNIRELGYDRLIAVRYNDSFTAYVNDAEINYSVELSPYIGSDGQLWVAIKADKEHVYISKHRHREE